MLVAKPVFHVVAGPSGAGKSSWFKESLGVDIFNLDDRAAVLNGGSFLHIEKELRDQAYREFGIYGQSRIDERKSFTTETTLRTTWAVDWLTKAREAGFEVDLTYVAAGDAEAHVKRVTIRADHGGHSAPERGIREIYERSMANLPLLFDACARGMVDNFAIFDNSGSRPFLLISVVDGVPEYVSAQISRWLELALMDTVYTLSQLYLHLNTAKRLPTLSNHR